MREIVHLQAGQCGNQIGAKVCMEFNFLFSRKYLFEQMNDGEEKSFARKNRLRFKFKSEKKKSASTKNLMKLNIFEKKKYSKAI